MIAPFLSATAALVVLYIVLYVVLPSLAKIVLRNDFLRRMEGVAEASLTFDDGPDPLVTPKLLELLDEAGVKATFFVVGKKVEACPELVTRMIDTGHEVGEHTNDHYFPWTTNPIRAAKDVWGCARKLDGFGAIAKEGRLYRPPFGKFNFVSLLYILIMRRRVAFWSVDPQDYSRETGAEVASRVVEEVAPGSVVLLHDGTTKIEQGSDMPVVVVALKGILEHARTCGIKYATLGSILPR